MSETEKIKNDAELIADEFIKKADIKPGSLVVIGCSTSEVLGAKIGTVRSPEIGEAIFKAFYNVFTAKGISICAQCCEHLNRALIIEQEVAEKRNFEIVCVVPHPHAGGSFATAAYHNMKNPVAVEEVKADAGIDIGNTLIGMHLKRVAVPLRLENNTLGSACVNSAFTRPKLIGGERAIYK